MPPGIEQAYFFQVFNTISFSIIQGLPLFLFLKFLGASDTVMGLAAALNPLTIMLQIPAASHVERIGYRAFVLRGWTARTFFIAGIMTVPILMLFLDRTTCMVLTMFFLFVYSALRGISTCAFLPWITQLVPEKMRGAYLSRDQLFSALASLITILSVAALFYPKPSRFSFAIAFFVSFVAGLVSLLFLRKMPDVPIAPSSRNMERVPWREMLLFSPFLKQMKYNLLISCAYSANGAFWMPVLREQFHWTSSQVLSMASASTLMAILVLWFFGQMIDRVGSLPILRLSGILVIVHFLLWFTVTSKLEPLGLGMAVALSLTGGLGGPLFGLANTRLLMSTVPEMGRSHFFALFSVINSIVSAITPILTGILLDALRKTVLPLGVLTLNNYALLYIGVTLIMLFSFVSLSAIKEQRAMSSDEFFRELLVTTPSRAITRLWRGRSFFG